MDLIEKCEVDLYYKKCKCYTYEVSNSNIGKVGEIEHLPLDYCDDLIGFKPYYFSDLENWFHDIYNWLTDINRMTKELQ